MPKITITDFGSISVKAMEITEQQAGQIIAFVTADDKESPHTILAGAPTKEAPKKPRKKSTKGASKVRVKEASVRDEIRGLEIIPKPNKITIPPYRDFKSNVDKILWILVAAREMGLEDGLTASEINYIASKRLVDKPFSNITTLTISARKGNFMTSDGGVYKVLHDGIDRIKQEADE